MKLNKILLSTLLATIASASFAVSTTPTDLLANTSTSLSVPTNSPAVQKSKLGANEDTDVFATIKICNYISSNLFVTFTNTSSTHAHLFNNDLIIPMGDCQLTGLREQLATGASSAPANINIKASTSNNKYYSVTVTNLSHLNTFTGVDSGIEFGNIINTLPGGNQAFIYYNQIVGQSGKPWQATPIVAGDNYQNLSGGVLPDYAICFGSNLNNTTCNDAAIN